jgi:hypothetical protein
MGLLDDIKITDIVTACMAVVTGAATIVYVVLTNKLSEQTKRQADTATRMYEASRHPHLQITSQPTRQADGFAYQVCLMNFSQIPVRIHGGFIQYLDTTKNGGSILASVKIGEYSRPNQQNTLELGDTVILIIDDHKLKPDWYVLRIQFSAPTFPNQILTFDTPFAKAIEGVNSFFSPYEATYNLEEKDGKSPSQQPTLAKVKNFPT